MKARTSSPGTVHTLQSDCLQTAAGKKSVSKRYAKVGQLNAIKFFIY